MYRITPSGARLYIRRIRAPVFVCRILPGMGLYDFWDEGTLRYYHLVVIAHQAEAQPSPMHLKKAALYAQKECAKRNLLAALP